MIDKELLQENKKLHKRIEKLVEENTTLKCNLKLAENQINSLKGIVQEQGTNREG